MVDDAAAGVAGSADDAGTAVAGVADEATAGVAGFADEAGAGVAGVGDDAGVVVTSGNRSDVLLFSAKQLQRKYQKHASDFGIIGNNTPSNAAKFSSALNQRINSPSVRTIVGTYRKKPVIHYVDPASKLNVITTRNGEFISGWKLNDIQPQNVLTHGGL